MATKLDLKTVLKRLGFDQRMVYMFALKHEETMALQDYEKVCVDEDGRLFCHLELDRFKKKIYDSVPNKVDRYRLAQSAYMECETTACNNCNFRKVYREGDKWCLVCYEDMKTMKNCDCLYTMHQGSSGAYSVKCNLSERCSKYLDPCVDMDKFLKQATLA